MLAIRKALVQYNSLQMPFGLFYENHILRYKLFLKCPNTFWSHYMILNIIHQQNKDDFELVQCRALVHNFDFLVLLDLFCLSGIIYFTII